MRNYKKEYAKYKDLFALRNKRMSESGYLRNWHLQKFFGISLVQYNELFSQQNSSCAICETKVNAKGQSFHVDHNHLTGKIRGLLCHNCNRGIGYLKDSPELLEKALNYLRRSLVNQ